MAKAIALTEDFTSYNSTKWYRSNAPNVAYASGRLQLTPTTSYHYLTTNNTYDLTSSSFSVQFVQNCNYGSNHTITTSVRVELDSTNFFEFEIGGGPSGTVTMRERVAGVDSTATTTYNASTFAYLRLRESAGTIYWETSTDGTSWNTQHSKTTALNLTSIHLLFVCGRYMAETSPGTALFDNLNPPEKAETLTDNFSTANEEVWNGYGGGVATVTGGQLVLAASGNYYPPLETSGQYVLTGSYVAFQLVQNLPEGTGTYTTLFYANVDASNSVSFTIDGGSNLFISMTEKVSGVSSTTTIQINPLRHKWLRIREASGTVYWETSIDGAVWVVRRSKATTLNLGLVTLGFNAGAYGVEPDIGTAIALIDNLNLNSGTTIGTDQPLSFDVFTDDFSTISASKWYSPGGATTDLGRLKFPVPSNDYEYMNTVEAWDLTNSSVCWQVLQNANTGNGSITTQYILELDTNHRIELRIAGGETATMSIMQRIAGVDSVLSTKAYAASKNKWYRFREEGNILYWETSTDGAVWSIFYSSVPPISINALTFRIVVGSYQIEADPGNVIIDNFNIPNTSILSQIGWYVGDSMPFGGNESGTVQAKNFFKDADWLWQPIPDNPVLDPMSSTWGGYLQSGSHSVSVWDFANTIILPSQIKTDTPRYRFNFTGPSLHPDWGLTGDPTEGHSVPVPYNTHIPPGSDGHLCVIDPITRKVFSFWQASYDNGTDTWTATWGGITDFDGDGRDYFGSATATNISRAAGVVLENELAAGEIPHAIFTASGSTGPGFRYPAQKSDGANMAGVAHPIPQGVRVQLDPSIDLSSIPNITPGELAVGRALQRYGAYLGDQGGGGAGFGCQLQFLWDPSYSGNYLETPPTYQQAGFLWDYFDMSHIPWAGNVRVLRNWDGS